MPRQVLFIQGGGAGAHDEWDNQLVESLARKLGREHETLYPRMPDETDPNYERWRAALKAEFTNLDEGAILVGHSIGAAILTSVLGEDPSERTPGGLFLTAAPFVGKGGWSSEDMKPMTDLGKKLPPEIQRFAQIRHDSGGRS